MNIDKGHLIYNIQITENVFQWNLFFSKFSNAAPNYIMVEADSHLNCFPHPY